MALLLAGAPAAVAAPASVSPDDTVKEKLATKCGEAWFWSGRDGTLSVQPYAEKAAKDNNGFTLAAKLAEQKIPQPTTTAGWAEYSEYFAEGAKCEVHAVLGASVRTGSIWNTVEYPTLVRNDAVTYVWRVDQTDDQACVHWKKPTLPTKPCYKIIP